MAIVAVESTHTPNAGRVIINANDTDLQSQITTDVAALTTHKASSDHDGRYYTETEVDSIETTLENADAALQTNIDAEETAREAADADLQTSVNTLEANLASLREKGSVEGLLKSTKNSLRVGDVDVPYNTVGILIGKPGCIVGVHVTNLDTGTKESKTQAYRNTGTAAEGRFGQTDYLNFYRNTSTGSNNPVVNGAHVSGAGLGSISVIDSVSNNWIKIDYEIDAA